MDACGKPTVEQAPSRICDPVERGAHTGTGVLAGLVVTAEQFVKSCSPWEGLTLEMIMENCLLWNEKSVRVFRPRREEQ